MTTGHKAWGPELDLTCPSCVIGIVGEHNNVGQTGETRACTVLPKAESPLGICA